jgi:hypothetical protein
MTTTAIRPPSARSRRPIAMYVGLALTVLATLAPLLDLATADTLSDHVRAAYPHWGPALVREDRDAIATYLVLTGALGIPLWILTARAVRAGRRWARVVATAALAAGVLVALTNLSVGGDGYHVIVPYTFGTLTLLPCLAGLAAVVSAWRR